jgi:hypothetical protein
VRHVVVIAVLLSLLVACAAGWAEQAGAPVPDSAYQGWRVHGGVAWPKDVDQQTVWGADYVWKSALITANFFEGDRHRLTFNPPLTGATHNVRDKFWSVEASYLWRPAKEPTIYMGAGWGLVRMERYDRRDLVTFPPVSRQEKRHDTAGLGNLVVGKEFARGNQLRNQAFFLEARYNFAGALRDNEFRQDVNVRGMRLVAGWRF